VLVINDEGNGSGCFSVTDEEDFIVQGLGVKYRFNSPNDTKPLLFGGSKSFKVLEYEVFIGTSFFI
jgi:hypothetical protein